ncbi:WD repeat-containing protein 89-like [Argiope bruennichi]|uniref:WD repeat-containing protein 89-like n=1 Tax=Argiope bruennichi TaxID=94029 RepID=UPI0024942A67|nr:WD repeat-containing protein 89-like [Argiope bruennichi]
MDVVDSANGDSLTNGNTSYVKLVSKQNITKEYILHLAVNNQAQPQLAVALSTNEILYFDVMTQAKSTTYKGHEKSVTGIKFSQETPSTFYSSSVDGSVLVWDSRSGASPVQTFSDDSDGPAKPLTCFDLNSDEAYVCAGTELIRQDSFLLFWDRRTGMNVGGYWNSHTDEISHVQFHSSCNYGLASSSVDGLINIYDLTQNNEDEALTNTLNTETSVNKFTWGPDDHISCITGTEEYQFWSAAQTSPTLSMTRDDLTDLSECKIDYLVDTFLANQSFYLVSGTNDGSLHLYRQKKKHLKPANVLNNGHTDIVRAIIPIKGNCLVTGGEDGQLCTWRISL